MNKPAWFFAATTALFALSTLYFARQITERDPTAQRAHESITARIAAAQSATPSASPAVSTPAPATPRRADAPSDAAPTGTHGATPRGGAPDRRRETLAPFARDYLRQYDDLAQRDLLLATARKGLEAQYAGLRERLKLDQSTFGQLVSLLAEESIEQQASYFRCLVDAGCNLASPPMPRERSDEYLALLGADRIAEFNGYREAMPEWQSVVQLRGRLSEAQSLRDGDAERLRVALIDARKRYGAEVQQQGDKLEAWGMGSGMLWYSGEGSADQKLASATQYSQRLRQQAAAILSADQLRQFALLQDELLASFAAYLLQSQANP